MAESLQRAATLVGLGRYELAERELLLALREDSANAIAYAMLSQVQLALNRKEAASASARMAISLCPEYAYAHYIAGHAYYELDQQGQALRAVVEAIRLDPTNPDYLCFQACILSNTLDWKGALESADAGLRVSPWHVNCLEQRVRALQRLGRLAEAEESAKQALASAPDGSLAHRTIAKVLLEGHHADLAYEHFSEARRLMPNDKQLTEDVMTALGRQQPILCQIWRFIPVWHQWRPKQRWCYCAVVGGVYVLLLWLAGLVPESLNIQRPSIWKDYTILWAQGNPPVISKAASIWAAIALNLVQLPFWLDVAGMGVAGIRRTRNQHLTREMIGDYGKALLGLLLGGALITYFALVPGMVVAAAILGMMNSLLGLFGDKLSAWPVGVIAYVIVVGLTVVSFLYAGIARSNAMLFTAILLFAIETYFADDVVRWGNTQRIKSK